MAIPLKRESPLLHLIVVGFHHKKGCQVEYAYPPLVEGTSEESGELPPEWKYLPSLALPDGAHNYSKDTVYFHLKNKHGPNKPTVYGVSCYRQMDAKDIINKTEDITRGTVQKALCVLTTLPYYGAIATRLELITHAWFDQKDFTKVSLLQDAFCSLQTTLASSCVESQAMLGVSVHDVVKLYKHKLLVLFKLMMLERKVVFFMTPIHDLCNVILSTLSLFPGLLEHGLVESVQNTKTPLSPTMLEKRYLGHPEPYMEVRYTGDEHSTDSESRSPVAQSGQGDATDSTDFTSERTLDKESMGSAEPLKPSSNTEVTETKLQSTSCPHSSPGVLELDTEDSINQIDLEDQDVFTLNEDKATLAFDDGVPTSTEEVDGKSERKRLTIDVSTVHDIEIVPVVSPTSISIDRAGHPLAIFTKGSVCHPYLSLSYYDILEDINVKSFVIGASNVLFKQKRRNIDVLVEDDPESIQIMDKELQRQLRLTTEDLRFMDNIRKRVDETVAAGEFLEATEWEGGDEWIRAQFKEYLQSLMASVLADDDHLLEAFNNNFVSAWKLTHNYRVWRSTVQQLEDVIPGHPCQGSVTLNDVKIQLSRTERGRKINAVVGQAGKAVSETGKAVGGAIINAKSFLTSWWGGKDATNDSPTHSVDSNTGL